MGNRWIVDRYEDTGQRGDPGIRTKGMDNLRSNLCMVLVQWKTTTKTSSTCIMSLRHKKGLTGLGLMEEGTIFDSLANRKNANRAAVKTTDSKGTE